MENTTQLGINRTGIQMSPTQIKEMLSATEATVPSSAGDERNSAEVRSDYISEADLVGSVPVPATFQGMFKTGMEMLSGSRPQVLIDKLGERLAFERSGARLYDALIVKFQTVDDGQPRDMTLDMLQQFRAEEATHFQMVAEAIESLGGDPTAQTPSADLAGVESMGLMQVLNDPRTTTAQCLHAMLVAELADHDGWDMLIRLTEDAGQDDLAARFRNALDEERVHLQTIRNWYEQSMLNQARLGQNS